MFSSTNYAANEAPCARVADPAHNGPRFCLCKAIVLKQDDEQSVHPLKAAVPVCGVVCAVHNVLAKYSQCH
jgi:hypothetical protein